MISKFFTFLTLLLSNAMIDLCKSSECFIATTVVPDNIIEYSTTTWHTTFMNNFVYYTKIDVGSSTKYNKKCGDNELDTGTQVSISNVTTDICADETCWIRFRTSNETISGGLEGYYDYSNNTMNLIDRMPIELFQMCSMEYDL